MDFDACIFNKEKYDELWKDLNTKLKAIENGSGRLDEVLVALYKQQFDQGFVQDDLSSVIRCRLCDEQDHRRSFRIQFNPRRASRSTGAGRTTPPPCTESKNGGCFLDRENVRWQQRGIEIGYEIAANKNSFIAWMNPFPLMPIHVTIATVEHQSQSWAGASPEDSKIKIGSIVTDLLDLAKRLPGFVGFYNGAGAGATIPGHLHFQFFKRPEGPEPFSLEQAAARVQVQAEPPFVISADEYPITTIFFHGSSNEIIEQACPWIFKWTEFYNYNPDLSANIIVTYDLSDPNNKHFHLYFVPRNKYFSHAPGMIGLVGGLEVFGELVFSTDLEKQQLDTGRVNYQFVASVLRAVEAPGVREFVRRVR